MAEMSLSTPVAVRKTVIFSETPAFRTIVTECAMRDIHQPVTRVNEITPAAQRDEATRLESLAYGPVNANPTGRTDGPVPLG